MTPRNTCLGRVSLYEIYEEFNGPKIFSVKDAVGTLYLVYWCDETEEFDSWLYMSLSQEKLKQVRRKELSLAQAFSSPQIGYYVVNTYINPADNTAQFYRKSDLPTHYLPPDGYFVEFTESVDPVEAWVFEVGAKKRSQKQPSAQVVSQLYSTLRELVETLMKPVNGKSELRPLTAVHGSFVTQFASDDDERAIHSLQIIKALIDCELSQLDHSLRRLQLDPYRLARLLQVIRNNGLEVSVKPKVYIEGLSEISISSDEVEERLHFLASSVVTVVDSLLVPQANNLDRVVEVVQAIERGDALSYELFDGITSKRQLAYYVDAARALGLLNHPATLTSSGEFLLSKPTKKERYEYLADSFERSPVGWSWIKWAEVGSIVELDPSTAPSFLRECVRGLSDDTAVRRSTTLAKWLTLLKPYHRKYGTSAGQE